MKRTHYCGEINQNHVGQTVFLQGWVNRVRDFPDTYFVVLRDRSGIVQIVIDADNDDFQTVATLRAEFVIELSGVVRLREEKNRTDQYPSGAIEIVPTDLKILSKSKPLPFPVDGSPVMAGEDVRLKYRYLDLRREPLRAAIQLRHKVISAIYSFLSAAGFVSVETPMLTKSTPEGARDFLVPSRRHGEFYALPQSPQLFKQLLMIANFDKYFQIARCFRDEDLRSDRQPDFTQLDIEMSFVDVDDVIELNEGLMQHVFKTVLGKDLQVPFPRITYSEAMNRFGSDKPDQRFGLELVDVGPIFKDSEFVVFKNALATAGTVKAILAPSELSRKQIEQLESVAKHNGAKGLAWAKSTTGGLDAGVSKFFSPTEVAAVVAAVAAQPGQTILFVADTWDTTVKSLGAVRLVLREMLGLPYTAPFHFSWVVDFPLLEWDSDNNKWTFMHHPFTSPKPEDILKFGTEQMGQMTARAYDLVLNGFEIGGGSIRIHQPEVQEQMFAAIGFSLEEANRRFGFFLEALEYGTPPHGGIAWGLDRVCAVMAGAESIRDVIAFPKNNRGIDPMAEAPSLVDAYQLKELGLTVGTKE